MNELEIQMCGMSRSGNHAIANWMFLQAPEPKLLLNCAEGKTDPFHSCRPLASGKGWRAVPDRSIATERWTGCHPARALVMHTYEDSWLRHAFSRELARARDMWLGPSRRRIEVLVLRDPLNLFASRRKMGSTMKPHVARQMWKQHAKEALRLRNNGNRIAILYNRWCCDRPYRQSIIERCGWEFTDAGIDRVPDTAGGSSFDGSTFDGKASHMTTGQRWKEYADSEEFRLFFDDETIRLSDKIFGMAPEIFRPEHLMSQ